MAQQLLHNGARVLPARLANRYIRTNLSDRFERMEDHLSVQEPPKETESNEWYLAYFNEVQDQRIKLLLSEFVLGNYRAEWFQYFLLLTNTDSHHSLNVSVFDTRTDAPISEDYEDFQIVLDLDDLRNYSPPSGWEPFKTLYQVLTMRIVSLPKKFCFTCTSQEHDSTACDQPSQPDTMVRIDLEDRLEQLQQLIAQAEGVLLSTKLRDDKRLHQHLALLPLPSSQNQSTASSGSDYKIISLMNPWIQLPSFRSYFAQFPRKLLSVFMTIIPVNFTPLFSRHYLCICVGLSGWTASLILRSV
ncbi:unnamed protein product [Allacma fusca]|uniref:Uncharacterized protein n=1 Tax=Allacma fusca TaxID=39272 RepID=A0A8J2L6K0_9HEXA|nr:unnamed protein product [Allacma fusca]